MQRQLLPPKRKYPRQARAKQTIEAILQAAAHILSREGEAKLTTNRIAERAGFSIGSLYQYFPNKEAILLAAFESRCDFAEAGVKLALENRGGEPFEVVICDIARILVGSFFIEHPARRAIARLLMSNAPAGLRGRFVPLIAQLADAWAASSAFDGVPLDDMDIFVLSCAVQSTLRNAILEDIRCGNRADFERALSRLMLGFS